MSTRRTTDSSYSKKIRNNIVTKMVEQLETDLTTGMLDKGKIPYTNAIIEDYIKEHYDAIITAATEMYNGYQKDEVIHRLGDGTKGELSWYREFLYDYVTPPNTCQDKEEEEEEFIPIKKLELVRPVKSVISPDSPPHRFSRTLEKKSPYKGEKEEKSPLRGDNQNQRVSRRRDFFVTEEEVSTTREFRNHNISSTREVSPKSQGGSRKFSVARDGSATKNSIARDGFLTRDDFSSRESDRKNVSIDKTRTSPSSQERGHPRVKMEEDSSRRKQEKLKLDQETSFSPPSRSRVKQDDSVSKRDIIQRASLAKREPSPPPRRISARRGNSSSRNVE
jgi:hypothetical protein